jgi:hypothetical protein
MVDYAARIARGEEAVKPGQPLRFTEASSVNDRIWQGDLSITITDNKVPKGMEAIETRVQLVPGNTQGAKHCLDGTAGVEMYAPKGFDWVTPNDDLVGPWMRLTQERTILHPVHGSVTIPAGFCAQIGYQREYDEQLKRERRARD